MFVLILLASISTLSLTDDDLMTRVPNYPRNFTPNVWSGYLATNSTKRSLHYIFMQSQSGSNNTDPLTLWMNGGPGCTSKLGFIQQIAPYFLQLNTPYSSDKQLTPNPYSWHLLSNLLFIDSPAGVGFSINNDPDYQYNDTNSAQDVLFALVSFFNKRTEYAGRSFYDLANAIYQYNVDNPDTVINLKGILVGNGAMNFKDGALEKSQIQYMVERDFIDPELMHYYRSSCQQDEDSAGCQFFYTRFDDLVGDINPYNVYGYCYPDAVNSDEDETPRKPALSQRLLLKLASQYKSRRSSYGDGDCQYDHGLQTYFTNTSDLWHSKSTTPFSACNYSIFSSYTRNPTGSIDAFRNILQRANIKVWLFNGDWDDVVPFRDNLKNLELIGLVPQGAYTPWMVGGQHAGFIREYPGLMFYIVKGAGHEVPQYQRQRAFEMFKAFLKA